MQEAIMNTPLDELNFPVRCTYPDCSAGPFVTGDQVDEHITEEHLPEAVWNFADDFIKSDDSMPMCTRCKSWLNECTCGT